MNLLIVDADGVCLDFALRCQEHGHEVKTFMRRSRGEPELAGRGLIEKVPEWEKWAMWADLIVPTTNGPHTKRLGELKKMGFPVFGPSMESARLEIERGYGMQVLQEHGINVPASKTFRTLDEAENYARKEDRPLVFKTLGSEEDKSLTYVSRDGEDMVNMIRDWRREGKRLKGECMLQDKIEGIEFGVSAWMGKDGFLKPRGESVEHKKLMSGNYGPNTGEMGTVMWYAESSKLAKQVLDPLEKFLLSIGHTGDVDVNCIIDEKGRAWPLEFTCRLGWPAFFIMCSQHEEPCQWMLDAMNGKDTLKVSEDIFVGVVVAIPPFPNSPVMKDKTVGRRIQGITPGNWEAMHLCQVMSVREEGRQKLVTTGEYVLCVTGSGRGIRQARKDCYGTVKDLNIRDMIVRDDIGVKFIEQLPELQKMGFALSARA